MTTKQSLLTGFAPGINLPSSVCVGHSDIPSSSAAHNLGVILDSQLALKEQVNIRYQLAYLEIKRFSSIRRYLSSEVTKTVVSSLVLSRLDNCNTVLAGFPQVLLDRIQRVINCSARLIYKVPKSVHITPFLYDLHWLPIGSRIQYKIALICFHIVSGTAPPNLSELLHLYSPSRCLHSAADSRIFRVPRAGRKTPGRDPFSTLDLCSGTHSVRHSSSLSEVKTENPSLLLCILICPFTDLSPVMHVFVSVCVC